MGHRTSAGEELHLGGLAVDAALSKGHPHRHHQFALLAKWIHSQGNRVWARPLVKEVTGEELTPQYLGRCLQGKFGARYDFAGEDS